jgi:hypothetical protein
MVSRVCIPAADAVRATEESARQEITRGPGGHPWAGPRFGETIPFDGHRTQQEVREDAEARSIRRMLGR